MHELTVSGFTQHGQSLLGEDLAKLPIDYARLAGNALADAAAEQSANNTLLAEAEIPAAGHTGLPGWSWG